MLQVRRNANRKKQQHAPYDNGFSVSHLVEHQQKEERGNRRAAAAKSQPIRIHHQQQNPAPQVPHVPHPPHAPHVPHPPHVPHAPHISAPAKRKTNDCYNRNKWHCLDPVPESPKRFKPAQNPPSNYSAESLISDRQPQQYQQQQPQQQQCQYFPTVQDANYNPFPTYNYQTYPQQQPQQQQVDAEQQQRRSCTRRHSRPRPTHRQQPPEAPPSYDLGFLSMPSNINSPLLGDDFAAAGGGISGTGALPPPLYYTRHYGGNNSPTTNTPTSLTNFNLSTIFPEIGGAGKGRGCGGDNQLTLS